MVSNAGRHREQSLRVDPVVAWPRTAEAGCAYLVTVDLRGPLPSADGTSDGWPHSAEEFTFSVSLEGAPSFVCDAVDEPSVVLHRFGGTYGPACFQVTAVQATGSASLWLTISNQWGVPVRKAELRSRILPREHPAGGAREAGQEEPAGQTERLSTPTFEPSARGQSSLERVEGQPHTVGSPRGARPLPPPDRLGADTRRQTLTVHYAGFNRAWANWISDRLERRGLRVVLLRWDAPVAVPLAEVLRDLLLAPGTVLLVLSEGYLLLGSRARDEWIAALREVVGRNPSRFAAVSVTAAPLPVDTEILAPVVLAEKGEEEAERLLLTRLGLAREPLPDPREERARAPRYPAVLPEVWGGVPRRNTRFTGREVLLNQAYDLLQGAAPGAGVVTFHGMSGMGKTQMATEYVYRFGTEYDVVWWVNAQTRATYRRAMAELAPKLGLPTGHEYGERLRAVRDSLRRGDPFARWLLVLDGADEPEAVGDLVPTGPGHVIITSRNLEWGQHNSRLLEVPVYTRDESVAFIRRRAQRLTRAEADQLADALEDLPLLLDQTAAWLDDSDLSVRDYIALLEDGVNSAVVKVSADFPLAFQTAWWILLERLAQSVPEAVELLRLCTFFAPGFIPAHLLKQMPTSGLPPTVEPLLTDQVLWNRAISQLRRYSVIRLEARDADSPGETFYLHRMVHQIVHQGIPFDVRQQLREVVRTALAAADPGRPTDTDLWPGYAEIVPHLKYADVLRTDDQDVQRLVFNCLRYLYFSGEYASGIRFGERALTAWRTLLGENHPRLWELIYHYGNLLRAAGDYRRTAEIEREAVVHLREQRGERDLEYLRALGGLAADLRGLAAYDEAMHLSVQVLDTCREVVGDQDARTLAAQNNLAVSMRLLGRYEESLEVDRRTMEARRDLLRARHPWTLYSELSVAVGLRLLGRYPEAESVQTRNLRECRIVMGHANPQTLQAEYNLALCLYRGGDRQEAGRILAGVLERGERVLSESHPLTLIFASAQSCFAREHGDVDLGRELSETVLSRYATSLTDEHPYTAGARANHALVLRRVGEREQALAASEESLRVMIRAVREDHPWALGCALNTSALLSAVGDHDGALALSGATVRGAVARLGDSHPLTLAAQVALAADLRATGQRTDADKTETHTLAALAATLGPQHPDTLLARTRSRPTWDFEPQPT
ncbi:FxSxx-COOH system tetratricopeptide repeat protein [Streptomyces asoensis]|uniref:ATP-binding protein n=1 Tax=Streptomyces asoensis TaxID=249586 RepID=A0ABQ3SBE0_9ACTN|nr:ATP-binding protein [Streptomyces asoensis]GHI65433.1 ATP-binding protein [Streptomyces asoensis]